ncbi:MAG: tyrosine/phenylalanine carboxypeptidase domain-containing protein [Kofleriaceae bacterium]
MIAAADAAPRGRTPVIPAALAEQAGVLVIGLEVPPLYRSARGVYPAVFRAFSRDLMHAMQRGFFEFTRVQTPARPEHYQMLGRRRVVQAVRESDLALAELGASFDFLLAVTPVNSDSAWKEFCEHDYKCTPVLRYRMLDIDPELGKRTLYALPLERLEDPVLAQLLRDKRRELDRQLGLLDDRDTPRFLHGSMQLYGGVEDDLLEQAHAILAGVPAATREAGPRCDAEGFRVRAEAELEYYRAQHPALATTVQVRDDLTSVMVSHGDLLIPSRLDLAEFRIDALLAHEIGIHVVTYANGRAQPLRVLSAGLANYESLQEGLAMFAEHLVGGLDGERLRLIAARVVAVRRLVEGASFPDVFAELVDRHHFSPRVAFTITLRVFRGGGLTKDAIYLRGLVQLLAHLRGGHPLDALLVGKIAFEQVALVDELLRREILHPPLLRPRWLDTPRTVDRLARASAGLRVIDLMEAA